MTQEQGSTLMELQDSEIANIAIDGTPGCVGRISAGPLTVGGQPMKRVPIPYEAAGETALELTFANGSRFRATASGVAVRVAGEGRFVESFAC